MEEEAAEEGEATIMGGDEATRVGTAAEAEPEADGPAPDAAGGGGGFGGGGSTSKKDDIVSTEGMR